jgi:uncharacterized repeat protein (TIGR01451 family)
MKFIKELSGKRISKIAALGLVFALAATYMGYTMAATGDDHAFIIYVYEGDPINQVAVPNAHVLLVADDRSSPSHGVSGHTDASGRLSFANVREGSYNVEVRHPDYYSQDFHMLIDRPTILNASMIKIQQQPPTQPPPPGEDGCQPTPPRGRPLLNIWPISESGADCTDYPLLAAKNLSRGTGYAHSIDASDNETIRVRLYVHNGTLDYPDNIAYNTMVKASVPQTSGQITAEAWADNADRINSSQKGGNVQVNIGNSMLELVPNSVQVYKRGPVAIAGGNETVLSAGLNLGNLNGCFEYLRFVTFDLKVISEFIPPPPPPPAKAQLKVIKTVVNEHGGTAKPSDFTMTVSGTNVQPSIFPGSASGTVVALDAGAYSVSEIPTAGYTPHFSADCTGSVLAGESKICTVTNVQMPPAKAKLIVIKKVENIHGGTAKPSDFTINVSGNNPVPASFQGSESGTEVLLDAGNYSVSEVLRSGYTPTFSSDCSGTISSGQTKTCTIINKQQKPPIAPSIFLEKGVRNVSRGETVFVALTEAFPGELLEFQLAVIVTGQVTNIVVSDDLPDRLNFVANSIRIDGTQTGNDLSNISLGTRTDRRVNITFRAHVASSSQFTQEITQLINRATVVSSAGSATDTAKVNVRKEAVKAPVLTIDKTVRNVTTGGSFADVANVREGETVEFKIVVKNVGTATAFNTRLFDELPSFLTFVENSFQIDGAAMERGNFFGAGGFLWGSLAQNHSITVTFKARPGIITENRTVTNTAHASADSLAKVTDTASVILVPVKGVDIDLKLSKKAFNETQKKDATTVVANPGDIITYTLTVENKGTGTAAGFVVEDDISDIIELAELTALYGGTFNINTGMIRWPAVDIGPAKRSRGILRSK